MTCSRCGAEAAVKRESAFYCGKCAMARDWEDIIAIVQSDRHEHAALSFDEPSGSGPEPVAVPGGGGGSDELPADPFG